jgi:hypothetical protein
MVVDRDQHGILTTQTTRDQRRSEASAAKLERRKQLVMGLVVALVCAVLSYAGVDYPSFKPALLLAVPVGLFGAGLAVYDLAFELLYQSGFQHMKGARVLDDAPVRPGLEDVKSQKAHGDGRIASEDEALAALNPNNRT